MRDSVIAKKTLSLTLALCLISTAILVCSAFFVLGSSNVYGVEVYSKNDKPFGTSLDGWMDKWWKW